MKKPRERSGTEKPLIMESNWPRSRARGYLRVSRMISPDWASDVAFTDQAINAQCAIPRLSETVESIESEVQSRQGNSSAARRRRSGYGRRLVRRSPPGALVRRESPLSVARCPLDCSVPCRCVHTARWLGEGSSTTFPTIRAVKADGSRVPIRLDLDPTGMCEHR
jgi:hypothetical protein